MNPLTGSAKFLFTTLLNAVLALFFFLFAAHFASPVFVGRVALLQLLELGSSVALTLIPGQVVNRELGYSLGSGNSQTQKLSGSLLVSGLLASPFTLFILLFPRYLWLSIPYYILYIYFNYQSSILSGLGRFTEVNSMYAVFTVTRWGLSTLGVFYGLRYLILFWTLGALVRTVWGEIVLRRLGIHYSFNLGLIRRLVSTGLPLYFSGITSFIAGQGDRLLVVYLLGSYYLGIYQLVALIGGVPSLLLGSLQFSLIPSSSYHYSQGVSLEQMGGSSFRLLSLFGFVLAPLSAGLSTPLVTLFPRLLSGSSGFAHPSYFCDAHLCFFVNRLLFGHLGELQTLFGDSARGCAERHRFFPRTYSLPSHFGCVTCSSVNRPCGLRTHAFLQRASESNSFYKNRKSHRFTLASYAFGFDECLASFSCSGFALLSLSWFDKKG